MPVLQGSSRVRAHGRGGSAGRLFFHAGLAASPVESGNGRRDRVKSTSSDRGVLALVLLLSSCGSADKPADSTGGTPDAETPGAGGGGGSSLGGSGGKVSPGGSGGAGGTPASDAAVASDGPSGGATGSADGSPAASPDAAADSKPAPGGGGKMSFFVSSTGSGAMAGNLGGLAAADQRCQSLATAVGAGGKTWHAFLSTSATATTPVGNARDRIGPGPWFNQKGKLIAADLNTLLTSVAEADVLDEKGNAVPAMEHDVLTGSNADGTIMGERTCANWTSNAPDLIAYVGHAIHAPNQRFAAHLVHCNVDAFRANWGVGRIYCFALD